MIKFFLEKRGNFASALLTLAKKFKDAKHKAAAAGAFTLMRAAQDRCPELTGDLVGSATIIPQAPSEEKIVGFYTEYAGYVHERTYSPGKKSLKKQANKGVTVGRKYLERAATEERAKINEVMERVYRNTKLT